MNISEIVLNGLSLPELGRQLQFDGGATAGEMSIQSFGAQGFRLCVPRLAPESAVNAAHRCVFVVSKRETLAESLARRETPDGTLAVVHLNPQPSGTEWNAAWRLRDGSIQVVDRIRFAGPGLVCIERGGDPRLTSRDLRQFSRTRGVIGDSTFTTLRSLRIAIVGTGRTGSLMAAQLVAIGARNLRLIDPDRLELSSLDAVPLRKRSSIGDFKALALARDIVRSRPDVKIAASCKSIVEHPETIRNAATDILITCVDNDVARLAASLLSRQLLVPHLDVATMIQAGPDPADEPRQSADIRLLLPGAGCTRCVGGFADEPAVLHELAAPRGALKARRQNWNAERAGSCCAWNSIAVGAALQVLIDLASWRLETSHWQRLAWSAAEGLTGNSAPVSASPTCGICAL